MQKPCALSPFFSLANAPDPLYSGTTSIKHDPISYEQYKSFGIPILAYAGLAEGYLGSIISKSSRNWEKLDQKNAERKRKALEYAERNNLSLPNVALAWLLSTPHFKVHPVIRTTSLQRFLENEKSIYIKLSTREWEELDCSV